MTWSEAHSRPSPSPRIGGAVLYVATVVKYACGFAVQGEVHLRLTVKPRVRLLADCNTKHYFSSNRFLASMIRRFLSSAWSAWTSSRFSFLARTPGVEDFFPV